MMTKPEILGHSIRDAEVDAFLGQELRYRLGRFGKAVPQFITPEVVPGPVVSIIIPTHNQLRYTQMCLASLRMFTPEPIEVVVVDNGSSDFTDAWLCTQTDVVVVRNQENRGFAAACNQGIAVARGEYLLLLNNDVVVTPGWLGRLVLALKSAPNVGAVGPTSNSVSGSQQVVADYNDLQTLELFSAGRGHMQQGQYEPTERLVGFCLLFPRSVLTQVGVLDEQFEVGMFEDDDFCRRIRLAGFTALIARDAFVHHFGSMTFRSFEPGLAARIYARNHVRFANKWERNSVDGPSKCLESALPSPSEMCLEGPQLDSSGAAPPRISLTMIVRDNTRTIQAALESIRPWVDEMVVVDTGSHDDTPHIATRLGARVFHFPWSDDFSAARNEAIRHARGEWIFWMDSDDTINAANGARLRALVETSVEPDVLGFTVAVYCPGAEVDGEHDVTVVDHVKLFRNRPALRFEGRIHEQILPAIRRAGGRVAWTEAFVVHSGYDHSAAGQAKKIERDLRLLALELEDRPNHPFTLFNLGMTFSNIGRHLEAVEHLRRCLAHSRPIESHVRKAYALLAYSLKELGLISDAHEVLEQGLAHFPQDLELQFRTGVLLQCQGRFQDAARTYQAVLATTSEPGFRSIDRGIAGFKTRHNLALALRDAGDLTGAERELRQVLAEVPAYRPALRALSELYLDQSRDSELIELAQHVVSDPTLQAEGHLLLGDLAQRKGDDQAAESHLITAIAQAGEDTEPLQRLCRFLFERGRLDEARVALCQLTERCPADASAHHNLGTIALHFGRFAEAIACYDQSLQLRRASPQTHLYRGYALSGIGRNAEARLAFSQALFLAPSYVEARRALACLDRRPAELAVNESPYGIQALNAYLDAEPDCLLNVGVGQDPHCEAEQFVHRWPGCRIVGWEPNPLTFRQRQATYPGEIRPCGVWSTPGKLPFWPTRDQGNSSLLRPLSELQKTLHFETPITVPVETLDAWFREQTSGSESKPFARAFLWLDIEGAELHALRGASRLLRSGRVRWILTEISGGAPRREGEPTSRDLDDFLAEFGFSPVGMETMAWSLNRIYRQCAPARDSECAVAAVAT